MSPSLFEIRIFKIMFFVGKLEVTVNILWPKAAAVEIRALLGKSKIMVKDFKASISL